MNEEAVISKKLIMALVMLLPLLCCEYQLILQFLFQCHILMLSSNLLVNFLNLLGILYAFFSYYLPL